MKYTELTFRLTPLEPWRDIIIAELGYQGYESFEENPEGFKAWIPSEAFDRDSLKTVIAPNDSICSVEWTSKEVEDRNWNKVWEENFQPVTIVDAVHIRAEHHPENTRVEYEVVIQPRMAFGTGHHATTSMMVRACLESDVKGAKVCDMGCGTAVLGIVARKMGAAMVIAIDNDVNAVDNAQRNCERNNTPEVAVEIGNIDSIKGHEYDLILANIQRNVLMEGMSVLAEALVSGGVIYLSGFILDDISQMEACAKENGLEMVRKDSIGDWALLGCQKN